MSDPFTGEVQEYEVNVFRIVTQSKNLTIRATSPQHAMEIAVEAANGEYARYMTVEGSAEFLATIIKNQGEESE